MKRISVLLLLLALMVVIGCKDNQFSSMADDTSQEAKDFDVLIALDEGDFDDVILALTAKGADNLTANEQVYLASAYLGGVGVDYLNALEVVNDDNIDAFGVMSSILGTDTLSLDNVDNFTNAFQNSLAFLNISDADATDDQKVLAGVSAGLDIVVLIGQSVMQATGATEVALTESGLQDALNAANKEVSVADIQAVGGDVAGRLTESLNALEQTITVFQTLNGETAGDDSIQADFEDYKQTLSGGDAEISEQDLACYISYEVQEVLGEITIFNKLTKRPLVAIECLSWYDNAY